MEAAEYLAKSNEVLRGLVWSALNAKDSSRQFDIALTSVYHLAHEEFLTLAPRLALKVIDSPLASQDQLFRAALILKDVGAQGAQGCGRAERHFPPDQT